MLTYFPPTGFHFIVRFENLGNNALDHEFQLVEGLSSSIETEEFTIGGENRFKHVLPVRTKFSNLVLKRGLLIESDVINWCRDAIENFSFKPVNITVILLNELHIPLMAWNVVNAYPIKWEVDSFNSMESKLVTETIELTYQYFTLVTLSSLIP
jgi:phage tail-like protein